MLPQEESSAPPWWRWALALTLIGLAFYATLKWLVTEWLGNPYYSHGFLVPLAAGVLAWRLERRHPLPSATAPAARGAFLAGAATVALGLGGHLIALSRQRYMISALGLIAVLAGTVLVMAGPGTLKRQAFPLLFLLLMIPLPGLEAGTPLLARWVAWAAGTIGRGLGLPAVVEGARVELGGTALVIGTPCSGINSLMALGTLVVLYAFLVQGRALARIGLVVAAVPIALAANLVRIVILLVLAHVWGAELAMRLFHDWSSPFLFVLALGLLIVVGKGLGCREMRPDI